MAWGWAFIGTFYPYDKSISGNIDFSSPKQVKIENPGGSATAMETSVHKAPDTTYIFAKSSISEIKSNKGYRGLDILVYKLEGNILDNGSRSISWGRTGNTKDIREKYESTIDIIRSEIKQLYFSDKKISNENFNISVSINSMYCERKTVFIVASVGYTDERESTVETVSEEKSMLIAMDMNIDDIYNYKFIDADGKEMLSELTTVSDKVIIFKGKEIIVADRNGFGKVNINQDRIETKETKTKFIDYDKEKVNNIGTGGGTENGIVVMQGEKPFNVQEEIQNYYHGLQTGKNQVTTENIHNSAASDNFLLGKSVPELGDKMVHRVEYKDDEMIKIKAKERIND